MNSYYLCEIGKIQLLTKEEEKALTTKAFSGDKSAQKTLVEHNLRFVVKIANQYKGYMEIEDLVNEGSMGLMHAAEKFDPSTGCKFSTYAVFWIKAYIQKAIRETSTGIRFPANKFAEMKNPKWNIASLDKEIQNEEDDETSLLAFIGDNRFVNPEDECLVQDLTSQLTKLVKMLKKNEQIVITKRFGLDGNSSMSLSEIGKLLGVSKERIRQIEKQALLELRKKFDCTKVCTGMAA